MNSTKTKRFYNFKERFSFCTQGVIADQQISSSAAEESLVKKLSAVCGKDGIKVSVRFRHPFHGVVYSDGNTYKNDDGSRKEATGCFLVCTH